MNEKLCAFPCDAAPLNIPLIGVTLPHPKYRIERPRSNTTVIEYVRAGTGYIHREGRPVAVGAGTVYLLCSGADQLYYADADDPWEKVFINVTGPLAHVLPHAFGFDDFNQFDGHGLEDIFAQVEALVEEGATPDGSRRAAVLFFEALYRLAQQQRDRCHSAEALQLKRHLDSHLHRLVGNDELAHLIFRSRDYCIKCFTVEYGVTPYEYQLRRKTAHACLLLDSTAMPIAAIGAAVGYTDPQYFSGLFKKRMGMTPSAYRKRQRPS